MKQSKLLIFLIIVSVLIFPILAVFEGLPSDKTQFLTQDNVKWTVYKPQARFIDLGMILRGWTGDCVISCTNGIHYSYQTHNLIPNSGHNFIQCALFGAQAAGFTCTVADFGKAFYLSASTDSVAPSNTDTSCPSQLTTNGFSVAAATVTAGTASGGSVSTTLAFTWTATAVVNNVQKGCIQTEAAGGANIVLFAENTFASTNLNTNDQITESWTITAT